MPTSKMEKCLHWNQTRAGSNQFEQLISCKDCPKILLKINQAADKELVEKAVSSFKATELCTHELVKLHQKKCEDEEKMSLEMINQNKKEHDEKLKKKWAQIVQEQQEEEEKMAMWEKVPMKKLENRWFCCRKRCP